MTDDLWNIFLNIVAAFIYAGIVWLWKNKGRKPGWIPQPVQASTPIKAPIDYRARNQMVLQATAQKFMFYFVTFATLYLSITIPALFKTLFSKEPILLNQARYIGEYLPAIPIGKDYLQFIFFVAAAVVYWPALVLSETITSLLYPLIDALHPVTYQVWTATTMVVFLVFCIPVAGTSVWLFYEKSYADSLLTVLVFMFFAFAAGQAQGGRR